MEIKTYTKKDIATELSRRQGKSIRKSKEFCARIYISKNGFTRKSA